MISQQAIFEIQCESGELMKMDREDYFELMEKLAPMDRCHAGPEMEAACRLLAEFYVGAREVRYPCGEKFNHWILPPYWTCRKAELKDPTGRVIASRDKNILSVFCYSPPFQGTVSREELEPHLMSDPSRPEAITFHFRNQYRHWAAEWGFCIPHALRENLPNGDYGVEIDSDFEWDREMVQVDYLHKGETGEEYMFLGHFDHPFMVNDGLAGCIAAFEAVRRLKGRKTRFGYRAYATVEIVGAAAYAEHEREVMDVTREALFVGFPGIKEPLVYQTSSDGNGKIDRIIKHILKTRYNREDNIYGFRGIAGNDENALDAVGIDIPTGTLMRWPFPHYHSDSDTMEITSRESMEEVIGILMDVIEAIETDALVTATFRGLPCLANPEINLYLSPPTVSYTKVVDNLAHTMTESLSNDRDKSYLYDNPQLFYKFMVWTIRMADGRNSVLDIAEKTMMPIEFVRRYVEKLEEKGLVSLAPA